MPRMLRLEAPGALAHIMARGIDGRDIFAGDDDRAEFLRRLGTSLKASGYKCLAWCLMVNHYHLLVRANEVSLERLMRPLNSGYARYYNRKNGRGGYLFQNRFKSVLCQDQEYAKQLIRYIHLNPVRAGAVPSVQKLALWKWCGHARLLGIAGANGADFQDRAESLRRFGPKPSEAVAAYLTYLEEGIDATNPDSAGRMSPREGFEIQGAVKGWPAVIGDHEFARQAMERRADIVKRKHRQADYDAALRATARDVCRTYGLSSEELLMRGWNNSRSEARAAFCYCAHVKELLPFAVIARFLGTTIAPVALLCRRGEPDKGK